MSQKFIIPIFLFVIFWCGAQAQNFFVNNENDKLLILNINGCSSTTIVDIGAFNDIASHPDGELYGVKSTGQIHRINTTTGTTSFLANIWGANTDIFTSLTANADGELFAATRDGYLFTYNPSTGATISYGDMGVGASGDLTFYQSNLYMASMDNTLMKIDPANPSNNSVFIDFSSIINNEIWGIVSSVDGCDVRTYATSNGSNSQIYQIDWDNQTMNYVCSVNYKIYGGSSEFEFNASADAITIDAIDFIEGDCNTNTGGVDITATSLNGSLEYSLDDVNYSPNGTFTNLPVGSHTIYILDELGCTYQEDFQIDPNSSMSLDNLEIANASCLGNDGSVTINATSTNGGLTYSLDGTNFQGSNTFNGLATGNYTAYAMDNEGCLVTEDFEIIIGINAQINGIDATDATCNEDNGSIAINATSSIGPLSFSLDGINFQNESDFINLPADNYIVIISDANGCTTSENLVINDIEPFIVQDIAVEHTTCGLSNGSIAFDVDANGNQMEYSINGTTFSNDSIFENVSGGDYSVIIQDTNGCKAEQDLSVEISYPIELNEIVTSPTECTVPTGSIEVDAFGGPDVPLFYILNGFQNNTGSFQELESGEYEIFIRNVDGCELGPFYETLDDPCGIYVPNVFSPNDDGFNDWFKLYSPKEVTIITCQIFNRWGDLVFEKNNFSSDDYFEGWYGIFKNEDAENGVYTYLFRILKNGEEILLSGDVTLVR